MIYEKTIFFWKISKKKNKKLGIQNCFLKLVLKEYTLIPDRNVALKMTKLSVNASLPIMLDLNASLPIMSDLLSKSTLTQLHLFQLALHSPTPSVMWGRGLFKAFLSFAFPSRPTTFTLASFCIPSLHLCSSPLPSVLYGGQRYFFFLSC